MIIQNIQLKTQNKKAILSAEIIFKGKKPENIYLAVDSKYQNYLISDASPFLAAFLVPCMKLGENIQIKGKISEKLYKNTQKIMTTLQNWNVGLKKIQITAETIQKDTPKPKYSAAFFSGGVDSFYTYLKHKKQISHFILVHGFDIDLENKSFFKKVSQTIAQIAKESKIKLITVETNMTSLIESKVLWDYAHGGALAAVALILRQQLKNVYISSAVRQDQLFPYGTHPDLDKYWSTEALTFHHDGTEYHRLEKVTSLVAKSPLAQKYLRVCNQNLKGKYNCSHCFKCLMTMMYLTAAGTLNKFKTFNHKIDLQAIRNMRYDYSLKYNLQGQVCLDLLKKQNSKTVETQNLASLQEAIEESLEKSKKTSLKQKLIKTIAHFDQTYNQRRLYQTIFKLNQNQDRNQLFKFLAKKGIIK